jgi:hypothetical protein
VEKRRNIQKWLAPWLFDEWTAQRNQQSILRDKGKAAVGSGSWLLDDVLPKWLRSHNDCLWLNGDGAY